MPPAGAIPSLNARTLRWALAAIAGGGTMAIQQQITNNCQMAVPAIQAAGAYAADYSYIPVDRCRACATHAAAPQCGKFCAGTNPGMPLLALPRSGWRPPGQLGRPLQTDQHGSGEQFIAASE